MSTGRAFKGGPNTKLDIYLLTGQSNASGSTRLDSAKEGERDTNVYENVRVFFQKARVDGITRVNFEFEPTREGMGFCPETMGPEVGMASYLNPLYDSEDRFALILKSADGGTSLLKHLGDDGEKCFYRNDAGWDRFLTRGSWYPDSLETPALKKEIAENRNHPNGYLTRQLKLHIQNVYRKVLELGFLPENIRFVSMIWVQGADDRFFPEEYGPVFEVFAKEIREAISAVTGRDYTHLPIVLGEVAETFSSSLAKNIQQNKDFIEAQNAMRDRVDELYPVRTRKFGLTKLEDGVSVPIGTDSFHWNYKDSITIGRLYAKCSYDLLLNRPEVESPMRTAPNYAFDHEPTVRELRETAVRAMRDMLTVQWYTPVSFTYRKTGAAAGKTYKFYKGVHYAGLPYTDINASLFGFLEYVDPKTGRLLTESVIDTEHYPNLGQSVNRTIGNTCSGSTGYGLFSVCSSLRGTPVSYTMTVKNGYYPVGDFTYDTSINEFMEVGSAHPVTTTGICEEYGAERIYECYALADAGDLVDMQGENRSAGHSMMIVGAPTVVRNPDGTIDGAKSTLPIQDQWTGNQFYPTGSEGEYYEHTGRILHHDSFESLFQRGFLPFTTAEFSGRKPYTKACVTLSGEGPAKDLKDLAFRRLSSNYPLAVVKLMEKQADGSEARKLLRVFNRSDIGRNVAFEYELSDLIQESASEGGSGYRLLAVVTTGETFVMAEF
ncbi:MAG: hypothetical protein J5794_05550 [Lachnospiraceae bacterium]|nr:hypothetical protein [Lachnospiraceae bacterium]